MSHEGVRLRACQLKEGTLTVKANAAATTISTEPTVAFDLPFVSFDRESGAVNDWWVIPRSDLNERYSQKGLGIGRSYAMAFIAYARRLDVAPNCLLYVALAQPKGAPDQIQIGFWNYLAMAI